jgi:uncharacterized membrane protein
MSGFAGFLRRRWPAVLLVVSLVVNGFLGGMMLTDALRPHHGISAARLARLELRRLHDGLPPAALDKVAAELQPLEPDIASRLQAMRTMRAEILRLAAEPTPDRAAIDGRLADLRTIASGMQAEVQKTTYDAVLALPPQDRARLADAQKAR